MKKINIGEVVFTPMKERIVREEIIDNTEHPMILSFVLNKEFVCLIWDEEHQDWIKKKPKPNRPNKPWETIIEPKTDWVVVNQCWCGSKQYSHNQAEPKWTEEISNQFKKKHKNCGVKRRVIETTNINFDFKEEENVEAC